jgi:hypothetical protein
LKRDQTDKGAEQQSENVADNNGTGGKPGLIHIPPSYQTGFYFWELIQSKNARRFASIYYSGGHRVYGNNIIAIANLTSSNPEWLIHANPEQTRDFRIICLNHVVTGCGRI